VYSKLEHARVVCKLWIINKRSCQLSYLDNFSSKLYKSHALKVFFKHCKPKEHFIRCFSSAVAYWTRMHGVIWSNPGQVKYFLFLSCSCHVVILYYPKNYFTKVSYFLKIFYHTTLHGPIASGTIVDSTSQVCSSTMLVLPILENWKVQFLGSL
jgi:hypothetical protein